VLVAEIDSVSIITALVGYFVNQRYGPHRAHFHASLLPIRPAFFQAISRSGAQVALHGHPALRVPYDPAGLVGAGIKAQPAAIAQRFVHHPHVAVRTVYAQSSLWTRLETDWIGTLAAYGDRDVLGKGIERRLPDLD
jgi:hypothetical protein